MGTHIIAKRYLMERESLGGGGGLAQLESAGLEAILGAQHDLRVELMLQRFEILRAEII